MAYGTVTQFRRSVRARAPRRRIRARRPWVPAPLMLLVGVAAAFWIAAELQTGSGIDILRQQPQTVVAPHTDRPYAERVLSPRFGVCQGPAASRYNCVIDGDTIYLRGERIRLSDIDAPELFSPQCARETELARRSTLRLTELINEGDFEVVRYDSRDRDRYDRKLRVLERHGQSLGGILVAEGLARPWDGARRDWC